MKLQMPQTLAMMNAEICRRHAAGEPSEITTFHEPRVCFDESAGVTFLKLTFGFSDGYTFSVHTRELPPEMFAAVEAHSMKVVERDGSLRPATLPLPPLN